MVNFIFLQKKDDFSAVFLFLRPTFSHGRLGRPQSLEYYLLCCPDECVNISVHLHFGEIVRISLVLVIYIVCNFCYLTFAKLVLFPEQGPQFSVFSPEGFHV